MQTLADIKKHSTVEPIIFADGSVPAGFFYATGRVVGLVTTYILRGEKGDLSAEIVGRQEHQGRGPVMYAGSGIKGGAYLGDVDVAEVLARVEENTDD